MTEIAKELIRGFGTLCALLGLLLMSLAPGVAAAATCPFNIPVVTLPPHQVGGFIWSSVIRPQGDACVMSIEVEPTSDLAWYVGGENGLYMTKDGGQSWTKPLIGQVGALLLVPGPPQLVYVGVGKKLFLSRDHGANWNVVRTYAQTVRSLLVAGGQFYVGLHWSDHVNPSGVFVSNLGGGGSTFYAFGPGHTGLIVWTLARDPQSGMLYAGTEIFDHPKPYHPPFFRSADNGKTWTNVAGTLPWHVIDSAVRPNDGFVYALTEGSGLFGSPNQGMMWQPPVPGKVPGVVLLMDPNHPTRLLGGRHNFNLVTGGVFESKDAGQTFQPIGLDGATVSGLAVNGAATKLFATAYASGIYVSPLPPP